jgi:hypothetical protein
VLAVAVVAQVQMALVALRVQVGMAELVAQVQ